MPGMARFVYDLDGVSVDRCPIALTRQPFTRTAVEVYSAYKRGITPTGNWSQETACYRVTMGLLESLESSAEQWYRKEIEKREKKRSG